MNVNNDEVTYDTDSQPDLYGFLNNLFVNPMVIIILVIIIVIYVIISISLGDSYDLDSHSGIIIVVSIIIIILAIINGYQYFMGVDIFTSIQNSVDGGTTINVNMNEDTPPIPEIRIHPQVFNIPGNTYKYNDAVALCTAYGSRLATYKEVENAYSIGAQWCNYGWSAGQMALFPTQQKTYDSLQKVKGHENDCGRPGVNGGYMANPAVKYGVNCYGYKPKITQDEETLMANNPPYPKTEKDLLMEKRVDYWKTRLTDILVSPFNSNTWSKF